MTWRWRDEVAALARVRREVARDTCLRAPDTAESSAAERRHRSSTPHHHTRLWVADPHTWTAIALNRFQARYDVDIASRDASLATVRAFIEYGVHEVQRHPSVKTITCYLTDIVSFSIVHKSWHITSSTSNKIKQFLLKCDTCIFPALDLQPPRQPTIHHIRARLTDWRLEIERVNSLANIFSSSLRTHAYQIVKYNYVCRIPDLSKTNFIRCVLSVYIIFAI